MSDTASITTTDRAMRTFGGPDRKPVNFTKLATDAATIIGNQIALLTEAVERLTGEVAGLREDLKG
jgi:hypothetical protein